MYTTSLPCRARSPTARPALREPPPGGRQGSCRHCVSQTEATPRSTRRPACPLPQPGASWLWHRAASPHQAVRLCGLSAPPPPRANIWAQRRNCLRCLSVCLPAREIPLVSPFWEFLRDRIEPTGCPGGARPGKGGAAHLRGHCPPGGAVSGLEQAPLLGDSAFPEWPWFWGDEGQSHGVGVSGGTGSRGPAAEGISR